MPAMADLKTSARTISKRLVASYVLDWIALIAMAAIAAGFAVATPHYRAFSPLDLSISFPYQEGSISTITLALVAGVAPAIIIFIIVFIFAPAPANIRGTPRMTLLRLKIWEWNVGWLALALTHATSQLLVQGMKNIAGKPRPDCLARCQPDLNAINQAQVGGYGDQLRQGPGWVLVDQTICQQTDLSILKDGFRSFPSGHATTSFAGLVFLSLYVASKFGIWFPLLPYPGTSSGQSQNTYKSSFYQSAAAAPLWLLLLVYIPIGVAVYITGTRFFEYFHFGFDLMFGALLGILSAYLGFRWYNVPLGRSNGWAWGARSPEKAFAIGVGTYGWVNEGGADATMNGDGAKRDAYDVEQGIDRPGTGTPRPSGEAMMAPVRSRHG